MISQKYIRELDFETIADIYKYIIESYVVGAISQSKELIKKMSKEQRKDFYNYLNFYECTDAETTETLKGFIVEV